MGSLAHAAAGENHLVPFDKRETAKSGGFVL
jgi:hypothetical protein